MPRKPRSLMNCHTCGGRSLVDVRGLPVGDHRAQLSTSSSRKRCSSAVSAGAGIASSFCQSGRPEKSSPSHHTVPASIASRSVCDIGGITLRKTPNSGVADERAAQRRHQHRHGEEREHRGEQHDDRHRHHVQQRRGDERERAADRPCPAVRVGVRERQRAGENEDDPERQDHCELLMRPGVASRHAGVASAPARDPCVDSVLAQPRGAELARDLGQVRQRRLQARQQERREPAQQQLVVVRCRAASARRSA